MKKTKSLTAFLLAVFLLLLPSCGKKEEYSPTLSVDTSLSLEGNVIYGKFVNVYFIKPYELIQCLDDGGAVTLYKDETFTQFLSSDTLELEDGENTYYLLAGTSDYSKEYILTIDCVLILDFEIRILENRNYHIGEDFDRTTVEVTAKKENGEYITVTDYEVEFNSGHSGEAEVILFYGGIQHSLNVTID